MAEDDTQKHDQSTLSPQRKDEVSLAGSMTEPEGPNTLEQAQSVGLYDEADEEHPAELNIAQEVEKDEREHQIED